MSTELSSIDEKTYPSEETRNYLQTQSELYERHLPQLLEKYAGMYIIFEDGKVIDADNDEATLVMGTYATKGTQDLFIKKVIGTEPTLRARMPFTLQ
ncbi:MAG: hypothetical protein AAFQ80_09230 [Cyanobacteria bacterium J06621_8]